MSIQLFLGRDGQTFGPFTAAELKAKADSGEIYPDDLIRRGANGRSIPAAKVKGLLTPQSEPMDDARSPQRKLTGTILKTVTEGLLTTWRWIWRNGWPAIAKIVSAIRPRRHAGGRIAKIINRVSAVFVSGESLKAYAIQRRLFSRFQRRGIVLATTGRFIAVRRRLLGGFSPRDIRWQDLKDVRLELGTFGATLTIVAFARNDLALPEDLKVSGRPVSLTFSGLSKGDAQNVYRICQAQEQEWREKRRVRELEELRRSPEESRLVQNALLPTLKP